MLAGMCDRLSIVIDLADMADSALCKILGYADSATLRKMRRREGFLDAEKLARIGTVLVRGSAFPNLHWVLTGYGEAFFPRPDGGEDDRRCARALNELACLPTIR